jgi:ATP synthase F1 gamma subunit
MANAKALDKRRKSVRNIRKITRTMELIATARFKKAMDRAVAATSYTQRITEVVANLANSGTEVQHPLLEDRQSTENATLIVLTGNRGLCGGYNGSVVRAAINHHQDLSEQYDNVNLIVSGKRGITNLSFRGLSADESYTHFEDQPKFDEVKPIADALMDQFISENLIDLTSSTHVSSQVPNNKLSSKPYSHWGKLKVMIPQAARRIPIMNSCPQPKASLRKLCRLASASNCSNAFWTLLSVNRSHGWSR